MIQRAILVAALMVEGGCASKTQPDEASLVYHQVRFYLPWKVDPQQMLTSRPPPPAIGFKLSDDKQALEFHNGRLKLNGKAYGTVKAGDCVQITEDGRVLVNGEPRRPDGTQP